MSDRTIVRNFENELLPIVDSAGAVVSGTEDTVTAGSTAADLITDLHEECRYVWISVTVNNAIFRLGDVASATEGMLWTAGTNHVVHRRVAEQLSVIRSGSSDATIYVMQLTL